LSVSSAANMLDGNFVIGVWASASRQQIRTLNTTGGGYVESGSYVQVSRLGMPLTNEAVIPIGSKDKWNSLTPYTEDPAMDVYFTNPELALYMDTTQFGLAVPAFSALRIQHKSLGSFDFGNGKGGLYGLYATNAGIGTALDTLGYGKILLRKNQPRSVDILPIFYTGVPNLPPYQLATGKTVNAPLSAGKPFVHNFMPILGDMLRLNMATPVTPRNHPKFSSLGLIQAAVLGLTDPAYNTNKNLQWIPNMDGFPNGRRLEDDVTRIELQAVSGVVLAAIGLWYDDYTSGSGVTPKLVNVLSYTTGVEKNDTTFKAVFPYAQAPWSGFGKCGGPNAGPTGIFGYGINVSAPSMSMMNYPNPFREQTTFKYRLTEAAQVGIDIYDLSGKKVATLVKEQKPAGTYEVSWSADNLSNGIYIATLSTGATIVQSTKISVNK